MKPSKFVVTRYFRVAAIIAIVLLLLSTLSAVNVSTAQGSSPATSTTPKSGLKTITFRDPAGNVSWRKIPASYTGAGSAPNSKPAGKAAVMGAAAVAGAAGTVSGIVKGKNGAVLANTPVRLYSDSVDLMTCTDAKGKYILSVPYDTPFRLSAGGGAPCPGGKANTVETFSNNTTTWNSAATLTLKATGTKAYSGVNFTTTTSGTLSGYVQDNLGSLMGNQAVSVIMQDEQWGGCTSNVAGPAFGTYAFAVPVGKQYYIQAGGPDSISGCGGAPTYLLYYVSSSASPSPDLAQAGYFILTIGNLTQTANFTGLNAGGSLEGNVKDATSAHNPVGDVPVALWYNGWLQSVCADSGGHYTFANVALGLQYKIAVLGQFHCDTSPNVYVEKYYTDVMFVPGGVMNWDYAMAVNTFMPLSNTWLELGNSVSGWVATSADGSTGRLANVHVTVQSIGDDGAMVNRGTCTNSVGAYVIKGVPTDRTVRVLAGDTPADPLMGCGVPSTYAQIYYNQVSDKGAATPLTAAGQTNINFTMFPKPGKPVITAPLVQTTNHSPNFVWSQTTNAAIYELEITPKGQSDLLFTSFAVAQVCTSGAPLNCTVNYLTPASICPNCYKLQNMAIGEYYVYVRACNASGTICGDTSNLDDFWIAGPAPDKVVVLGPSSPVDVNPPDLSWSAATFAGNIDWPADGQYVVTITEQSTGTPVLPATYYTSTQAECDLASGSTTCLLPAATYSPSLTAALNGGETYILTVKPFGNHILGPVSSNFFFTMATTRPGTPVLGTPNTTLTGYANVPLNPIFHWTAPDNAWMYNLVIIDTSSGITVWDDWYMDVDAHCAAGVGSACRVGPGDGVTPNLASNGNYTWMVTGFGDGGEGDPGSQTFKVNLKPAALSVKPLDDSNHVMLKLPQYNWTGAGNVTSYLLKVVDNTTPKTVLNKPYVVICTGTAPLSCTLTPVASDYTNGGLVANHSYTLTIRGSFGGLNATSDNFIFTMSGAPTLAKPAGANSAQPAPTFVPGK